MPARRKTAAKKQATKPRAPRKAPNASVPKDDAPPPSPVAFSQRESDRASLRDPR